MTKMNVSSLNVRNDLTQKLFSAMLRSENVSYSTYFDFQRHEFVMRLQEETLVVHLP